jgi:hypothetical protein
MNDGEVVLSNDAMDAFDRLVEHAGAHVPGLEANRALWDLRLVLETQYSNVVLYEIVVADGTPWDTFLRTNLPKFTEHLAAKGIDMLGGPNVILSIWRGHTMFVFDCAEFFEAVRVIEEISAEELKMRISKWRLEAGFATGLPGVTLTPERPLLMTGPTPGPKAKGEGDGKPS